MSCRVRCAAALATVIVTTAGTACSRPSRPVVRDEASRPESCADAVADAYPGGRRGTLPAYREVERRCSSLAELADRTAFDGSVLRIDCAPADVLALGASIPELGARVPSAPADLAARPVCRQFNAECADYDELRRDHGAAVRTPTLANLGLFVHHRLLYDQCLHRYGGTP